MNISTFWLELGERMAFFHILRSGFRSRRDSFAFAPFRLLIRNKYSYDTSSLAIQSSFSRGSILQSVGLWIDYVLFAKEGELINDVFVEATEAYPDQQPEHNKGVYFYRRDVEVKRLALLIPKVVGRHSVNLQKREEPQVLRGYHLEVPFGERFDADGVFWGKG